MAVTRRVTIVQQVVMQYRRTFYELLREDLARDSIELSLIHSNPEPEEDVWKDTVDIPWAHRVPVRYLPVGGRVLVWQSCRDELRGSDLVIVEQGSRHLLNYTLVADHLFGRRRVGLWGHGRNFRGGRGGRLAEWAKANLIRAAHWWFAYTELTADIVAARGFPRERITVVQNTIDTSWLTGAVASFDGGDSIRTEIGAGPGRVGMFLGKLHPAKRLDFVCQAADVIRAATGDFQLVIAGAGSEEHLVRDFAAARPWVSFVGPRFAGEKAALLSLADVLLMPAWAGLVVLDAFAAEVPLVTSASQAHPPEFSYIIDGVNGVVVNDGGSYQRYGEAVADLLDDSDRRLAIAAGCREARERYTVEKMVSRFASGVQQALGDC